MRNSSLIISLVAALGLLACASAFCDTVYKWKDGQGQSHYSQQPPDGVKTYETINTVGDTVADTSDASQPSSDAGDQKSSGSSGGAASTGMTPAQQQRQELCKQARDNSSSLTEHATVSMDVNGNGKPVTLNAAQHDQALSDANKQVDLYCSK